MPITITRLNAGEVLRYMGCPPEKADASLLAQVESCARELLEAVRPRWSYRVAKIAPEEGACAWRAGCSCPGRT